MAEIKNNFLGSKMNQDIDDRLMPNNEYRYALNLEVNRSEASDVGTLQNILGNSLAVDFNSISGTTGLECIGVLTDDSYDNIYVFLTNYHGTTYNTNAKNFIYVYNNKQNTTVLLVSGVFLNFSTKFPIYGVNIVENLLFWTDNRNQPRKINVQKASDNPGYYTNEEQISVAKLSPLYSPGLFRESKLASGDYETTMYDVTSKKLPNGTTPNPYYEDNWPGDPAYLESRYVRFSYRYKFEDGEYSIMAPFTQIAYIPKQDGFFMYKASSVPGADPEIDDETSAYRSTIVNFMQNKVNNIYLQIILPGPANQINSLYKIVEIEILYKEADGLSVAVVDSIPTLPDSSKGPSYTWNTTSEVYSYNYQSKKPFKTLPERDLIRVNDITPVKALSQEIVGNRVIYGNYQDKFSYPKYLNYNVGASQKLPFGFNDGEGTSLIEYPNHSVKENRNYQVGIVLCDRFGRQSGVILSDQTSTFFPGQFGASSLYLPYTGANSIVPYNWTGNSLKVLFNETISPVSPNATIGWPGLYNGDKNSADYNPLGWYSYKIVVKQTEQDYYNVYLPGTMAAYPTSPTLELGKTSHVVLLNDNINKVPRDLNEVGPSQKQFRSSVIMYPRVNNNLLSYNNEQYYPGNEYSFVSTIATNNSLFFPDGITPIPIDDTYKNFYQIDSDPLIARVSTTKQLGVIASNLNTDVINLSVFETKPVESKLDIYWETSTSGIISELNTAIQQGSSESVKEMDGWSFTLSEADVSGTIVTSSPLVFKDILGNEVAPTSVYIQSVITGTGVNITSKFIIENIPSSNYYRVKTAPGEYFYYGFNAAVAQAYTFSIVATIGTPVTSETFVRTGVLTNIAPTITNKPLVTINKNPGDIDVYDFNGLNGSNISGGNSTANLTWSVTGNPIFTIDSNGVLQDLTGTADGATYNLIVTLTDAGGLTDSCPIQVIYSSSAYVSFSSWTSDSQTNSTSGTVTVYGKSANFYAFASVYTGGKTVSVNLGLNGDGRTTFQGSVGNNQSSFLNLPPGTYYYSLSVNISGSGGYASGGVNWIQM